MKKKEFQDIFASVFADPPQWRRWFFDEVATDEKQIYIGRDATGKAIGALLMQPYAFAYEGMELPAEYMSCVATRSEARGHGVASRLIAEALADARRRGVAMCALVPAEPHLHFFYRRFGFSTVFYTDCLRFTAVHRFHSGAEVVEPAFASFSRLEKALGCGVLHSQADFGHVLADLAIDGGHAVAVRDADGAEAMLFAVAGDSVATVKALMADNEAVVDAALAELRRRVGELMFVVHTPPFSNSKAFLRPYGMLRIADPEQVLGALAAADPKLRYSVRLTDNLIHENSGIYTIRNGECRRPDGYGGHIDLEADIDTLAAILFSDPSIADIFSLPARRPYMTLMLD